MIPYFLKYPYYNTIWELMNLHILHKNFIA